MKKVVLLLLGFSSCQSVFDPHTERIALAVGDLVGVYLLRKGKEFRENKDLVDSWNWQDAVGDIYDLIKDKYLLQDKDCMLVERDVENVLRDIQYVEQD